MESVGSYAMASVINRRSSMQTIIRGEEVTWDYIDQCHICRSGFRKEVEEWIFLGFGATAIVNMLPLIATTQAPRWSINVRNIANHRDSHLPPRDLVMAALMDERALQTGNSFIAANGSLLDGYVFAKQVLNIGWEKIASGQMDVSVSDVLKVLKYIEETERGSDPAIREKEISIAFEALMVILRDEIGVVKYEKVMTRLSTHDVIVRLSRQMALPADSRELGYSQEN